MRTLAIGLVSAIIAVSCGSAPDDDDPDDPIENEDSGDGSETPADGGTVTPSNSSGVGGGEPIDNLDEMSGDDVDGDGQPG